MSAKTAQNSCLKRHSYFRIIITTALLAMLNSPQIDISYLLVMPLGF